MIFDQKTKDFQTISTHPDDNWTNDSSLLIIPDGSELAEKIIDNYPYFDCVFDGGVLVDVTPTEHPPEPEPTALTNEQITQILRAMNGGAVNAAL